MDRGDGMLAMLIGNWGGETEVEGKIREGEKKSLGRNWKGMKKRKSRMRKEQLRDARGFFGHQLDIIFHLTSSGLRKLPDKYRILSGSLN